MEHLHVLSFCYLLSIFWEATSKDTRFPSHFWWPFDLIGPFSNLKLRHPVKNFDGMVGPTEWRELRQLPLSGVRLENLLKVQTVCGYNEMLLGWFLSGCGVDTPLCSTFWANSKPDSGLYLHRYISCVACMMCQGCLFQLSMRAVLLENRRAQNCANECLAEGWWWQQGLLGSLGTVIRVFGGSCIHPEGPTVFVILAGPQSYN